MLNSYTENSFTGSQREVKNDIYKAQCFFHLPTVVKAAPNADKSIQIIAF